MLVRILMIDDSRQERALIKSLIAKTGIEVSLKEADSAEEALAILSTEDFDCLLIDYRLPLADGIEFAMQLSSQDPDRPIPTILITGMPSVDLAERALASGFTDFIEKRGLTAAHLRQVLTNALIRHRLQRSPAKPSISAPSEAMTPSFTYSAAG